MSIERVQGNQPDLQALVSRIIDIIPIVQDVMAVEGEGERSGQRFETICLEFQECVPRVYCLFRSLIQHSTRRYLGSLLSGLDELGAQSKRTNILKRYLVSNTVKDTLDGFKKRAEEARLDLSVRPFAVEIFTYSEPE